MALTPRRNYVEIANHKHAQGLHTVYVGDEMSGKDKAGNCVKMKQFFFMAGRAKVDGPERQELKDRKLIR